MRKYATSKDLWAGAVFIGVGALAMWVARDYAFGRAAHMGPGYMPTVLGALLVAFGLLIAVRPLFGLINAIEPISLQPVLLVAGSVISFGLLIERAGLACAVAALVVVGTLAGQKMKSREIAAVTAVLVTFAIVVFVYALGLPFSIGPR